MKTIRFLPLTLLFALLVSACNLNTNSQMDPDAFNTMVAQTAEVQLAQLTPEESAGVGGGGEPDTFAPDPLPAPNTGFVMTTGQCFDLDMYGIVPITDTTCDIELEPFTLIPKNGAWFSSYVGPTAPSLNTCRAQTYSTASFETVVDQYICFQTDLGIPGFFVRREISPDIYSFDFWLFDGRPAWTGGPGDATPTPTPTSIYIYIGTPTPAIVIPSLQPTAIPPIQDTSGPTIQSFNHFWQGCSLYGEATISDPSGVVWAEFWFNYKEQGWAWILMNKDGDRWLSQVGIDTAGLPGSLVYKIRTNDSLFNETWSGEITHNYGYCGE